MGRRSGAFGAFAAAATTLPTKTGAFSRFADEVPKNPSDAPKVVVPARTAKKSPAPELSLDEVRRLLEELRTVSNSATFQKDLAELRRMDWGAFKKREAVAKLLSISWKATLRKHGFSIDAAGFPNLLQVVKEHGHQPGIRLVSHEVERQLRMVPGALFRLKASTNGEGRSWKQEEIQSSRATAEKPTPAPVSAKPQEAIPRQIRGRPMFLGEAKEILKAFRESLLTPAVTRTLQNIEQGGGVHMEQHRRVLITQEWNPIMKRFDFPTTEEGYNAMKAGIREFAENAYVRSCCHEVEHLCGAPTGTYFGVPTAEELAAKKAAEAEAARRAEEQRQREEAKRQAEELRKAEERRKAEEAEAKRAEESRRKQAEEAEAKRKAEEAEKEREARARERAEEEARQQQQTQQDKEQNTQEEQTSQESEAQQQGEHPSEQEQDTKSAEEEQAQQSGPEPGREPGRSSTQSETCDTAEAQTQDPLERLAEEARQKAAKLRQGVEAQEEAGTQRSPGSDDLAAPATNAQNEVEEDGRKEAVTEENGLDGDHREGQHDKADDAASQEPELPGHGPKGADEEANEAPPSPDKKDSPREKVKPVEGVQEENDHELQCFDVLRQVALREKPSRESKIVGAAVKGAQLLGAVEEVGGQQWLHVSSRCCKALGALADSAWALVTGVEFGLDDLLQASEQRQPQALGYAGRYEVAHGKVAVRVSPSLKGKIVGVVHAGRILMGTPHKVGGYAWLRFEESSRKKVADIGEEAWALIDGEPFGLEQLLRPLDKDGRKALESFHEKQTPPAAPEEAPADQGQADKADKTESAVGTAAASEGKLEAQANKKGAVKQDAKQESTTAISDPAKVESRRKAAQQAMDVLSGPVEYKVLAQDHAAPVRREPLVQSPEVGKLEKGRVVLGYPGGGWLQLHAADDVERKLHGCWVFIGTRLSAQWAELTITGEFEGALELSWLGLRKEKRVAYNVEWRTPEGAPNPKKGHKISASTKVLVSGLPQGCELSFRVGARVAADGDQDDKDVRLWGSWTQLLTGQFS